MADDYYSNKTEPFLDSLHLHHHHHEEEEEERSSSTEVAKLLGCTSWSGAGPSLMDAATHGALQAGMPVGGFKIAKEANQWTSSNFHPYLPSHTYLTCRFFSARKHGLVDAVVRTSDQDKTAVIALPCGIGTLDEAFEILALIQLERIGSALPVPFILMNYDSFYTKLLEFLEVCENWGTVSKGEVSSLWKVCNNDSEALAYLAEFYDLDHANQQYLYEQIKNGSQRDNGVCFMTPTAIMNHERKARGKNIEDASRVIAKRLSTRKQNDLVLLPYNPGRHWVLGMINMKTSTCYYLDSLTISDVNHQFKQIVDAAIAVYDVEAGTNKRTKLNWVNSKPGSTECGYFTLKFMKEVVKHGVRPLENDTIGGDSNEYTDADIDDIREEWAIYVSNFIFR